MSRRSNVEMRRAACDDGVMCAVNSAVRTNGIERGNSVENGVTLSCRDVHTVGSIPLLDLVGASRGTGRGGRRGQPSERRGGGRAKFDVSRRRVTGEVAL